MFMTWKEKMKEASQEKKDKEAHIVTIFAHEGEEGQIL
jgi:hypothetical protein